MTPPRCRLTIHLPHRELWLWRCVVLRALELPQTGEVPRVWEWYLGAEAIEVRDARRLEVVVRGDPDTLEADVRYALWLTLAPCHRGLLELVRIEPHAERDEEAQPAPLTRITPQEAA